MKAKRMAPKLAKPVVHDGITYSTEGMGFLVAKKDNKLLWKVQVYQIKYNPSLEKDVQDVFIKVFFVLPESFVKKLIFFINLGHKTIY